MAEAFIVGQLARLPIRITDLVGVLVDPGAVTLKIKPGAGAVVTVPDVVRDGVGLYHADIALVTAGLWAYRWELSAPNAGVAEGVISVQKSRVI